MTKRNIKRQKFSHYTAELSRAKVLRHKQVRSALENHRNVVLIILSRKLKPRESFLEWPQERTQFTRVFCLSGRW